MTRRERAIEALNLTGENTIIPDDLTSSGVSTKAWLLYGLYQFFPNPPELNNKIRNMRLHAFGCLRVKITAEQKLLFIEYFETTPKGFEKLNQELIDAGWLINDDQGLELIFKGKIPIRFKF